MKIGICIDPNYNPQIGGGFSYYDRLLHGIDNYRFSDEIEIVYICEGNIPQGLNRPSVKLFFTPEELSLKEKIRLAFPYHRQKIRNQIDNCNNRKRTFTYIKIIQDAGIKLLYYPIQTSLVYPDIPFIISNWDIGHRSTWMFPELYENGQYEWREEFYNKILPKALMVLCESESGREELIHYTNINPHRAGVMPLFAGEACTKEVSQQKQKDILERLGISSFRYFYYPAQFWAHKNHITLLQAFKQFVEKHHDYHLVFTGSDQGNKQYVLDTCSQLGLDGKVVFAGFVNNEIVATLYRNASAMVMPTLLGPTNMPLLEAMQTGCPVICSDIPGHREELADSALYIDPMNHADICQSMEKICMNWEHYHNLIVARQSSCPFSLENALDSLDKNLKTAINLRSSWG